jgi:NTP pyrophosphatase (non-canonical NTP hydrolase)
VSITHLIECIGLPARDLRRNLLEEIEEFLDAKDEVDAEEEFGDILFALMAMAWAHSGRHFELGTVAFESKVKRRLRRHGALRRHPPRYLHDRIPELTFGVLHLAFGNFTGQWTEFDALKNGTVAEIHLLTDAPFGTPDGGTNHCIVTFDDVESIEYTIINGSADMEAGNIVLCRIPDFLFKQSKAVAGFANLSEYMSLQVMAAVDGLKFSPQGIAHFHSWEGGFMADSEECVHFLKSFATVFSPYLTAGRLKPVMEAAGGEGWTMTSEELAVAADYESKLSLLCDRVVLESNLDRKFYSALAPARRLDLRTFARDEAASFPSDPVDATRLVFIAGGRPVREKGFVELCREFSAVREWADALQISVSLSILCRERRPEKGSDYIGQVSCAIEEYGLTGRVVIEQRVSLEHLRRRITEATAVIVSSLYDPFCLMPTYAVEAAKPAFVSVNAGVSENIRSPGFTFDPQLPGDLKRVIAAWYDERPLFHYESRFPSYRTLYVSGDVNQ